MKCHPSRTRIQAAGSSAVSDAAGLSGRIVDRVRASADSTQYVVEIGDGHTWQCTGALKEQLDIGTTVVLDLAPEHLHLFRQ